MQRDASKGEDSKPITALIPDWVKQAAEERGCIPMLQLTEPVELTIAPAAASTPVSSRRFERDAFEADPDRCWREVLLEHEQRRWLH
jgi:hypothetical protein